MGTELAEQIRDLIDGGARPVAPAEIAEWVPAVATAPRPGAARSRRAPHPARLLRPRWVAAAAACAIAAAGAGVISLAQRPAAPAPPAGAVLTAAQVRQMAAASTAALAHSALAVIRYAGSGPVPLTQTETVAFSGRDYAIAGQVVGPAFEGSRPAGGGKTWTDRFGERVISGRVYVYFNGPRPPGEWIHYRSAVTSIHIADPRRLLALLQPVERFRFAGYVTIDGMRLERLRATAPAAVPGFDALIDIRPGRQVTAVQFLVDRHGVVRRIDVTLRGRAAARVFGKRRFEVHHGTETTNMTVAFSGIGRPQAITVPPHRNEQAGPGRHPWPAPFMGVNLMWMVFYTLDL